jgi:hypothetical protein
MARRKVHAHIGDVIENALGWDVDVYSLSDTVVERFAENVQTWSRSVAPSDGTTGAYYGGWPSANVASLGLDGVLGTALLFEERLIGKDVLSDWFAAERYLNRHMMGSRPGWLGEDGQSFDHEATRHFLANQIPAIKRLRPLLDSGVLRLIPSEPVQLQNQPQVELLVAELGGRLLKHPVRLARKFAAGELATDDTRRGYFVMAGGGWEGQTRKAFTDALHFFANEYLLSLRTGSSYTAPFAWESHVALKGLKVGQGPYLPVQAVLLASRLPVFSGLTADLIAQIHEDDAFASFRAELAEILGQCPMKAKPAEVQRYLATQQADRLRPILDAAERSADAGPLRRAGLAMADLRFTVTTGVTAAGVGLATGTGWGAALAGAASVGAAVADKLIETPKATTPIWKALVGHERSIEQEMLDDWVQTTRDVAPTAHPWGIPREPSMSVTVSSGSLLVDWHPAPSAPQAGN